MNVERITKWVTLGTAVAWFVLAWLTVIRAIYGFQVPPLTFTVGDTVVVIPLLPDLGVEEIGRAILNMLYTVFVYVVMAVVIIGGIQAAIGLVQRFIVAFLPISIPAGNLNTLIRTVLGLLIIKAIVDASLRYFGYTPATVVAELNVFSGMTLLLALIATWRIQVQGYSIRIG
ncbi:MAG: hypothetical protein QXZ31_07040 [Thermofilaceae archaeon]